ncbi:MAG: DNA polymerase III subunit delta [Pseudomonadota bacterium]
MASIRANDIDRFIAQPNPSQPIVLIYGPDRGRVSLRTKALIETLTGKAANKAMDLTELDPTLLDGDPSRLAEEADSIAMFGGAKLILVRMDDPKGLAKTVQTLLDAPPTEARVIISAGDLKKSHPLRSRIDKASTGAALPCYAADRRDIAALLDQKVTSFGLTVDRETRDDILSALGSDHAMSVSEIEKLCLYARSKGKIERQDVEDLLMDSSTQAMSDCADLAFAGQREAALGSVGKITSEGLEPSVLAQNLVRHGQMLERLRITMMEGKSAQQAVRDARPPIFFKRQTWVERALTCWTDTKLRCTLTYLDTQLTEIRLDQNLKTIRLERIVLRIASDATRGRR